MKILTFDIEDWFHILDNPSTKTIRDWSNYPSRINEGMDHIFDILEKHKAGATFFMLGWIAKKHPHILREIDNMGYEVGSHTHMHQLIYEQDKVSFKRDVEKSIKTIEDLIGKKVKYFRAPGFSIIDKNKWAFEVLYELGIEIDCSVFPANRAHGGMPNFKSSLPSIIKYNNVSIKEFPINATKILGNQLIFSGGGYFRLFPYFLINHWTKKSNYIMTYFHPRDFDFEQPVLRDLPIKRLFKSYVGLKKTKNKLDKWVNDFKFVSLNEADELTDWGKVPVIKLDS